MGWCNPDQPCESCGRTQADIDNRKSEQQKQVERKERKNVQLKPIWKRRKSNG